MKGRIIVCKEYGKPFDIEEYEVPQPEPGAVLLRMTQAGICGSDFHVWRGDQVNVPCRLSAGLWDTKVPEWWSSWGPAWRPIPWGRPYEKETG